MGRGKMRGHNCGFMHVCTCRNVESAQTLGEMAQRVNIWHLHGLSISLLAPIMRRIRASRILAWGSGFMLDWLANTLRSYPEIAIFISLALGYYFGSFTYKGLGLGAVTATLIAAVIIGQLDIKIGTPLKPVFFLMFLFAIGYGVGPQFVRGIAQDGVPQAVFSVVQCVFCLLVPFAIAKFLGYNVGSAVGLYAGSQTISASMGL